MDFDAFLGEIQKLITRTQQGDLFGNKQAFADGAAEVCVEFLKNRGYSIRPPMAFPTQMTKLDELVALFYALLQKNFESCLLPYTNIGRDRAIAKAFVAKRMEDDKIKRNDALQQCAMIIKTIFNRPDVFRFETPPSFGVLGQAEMGWITDRAVQIINKDTAKNRANADERAANQMTEEIEKRCKMGLSLDQLKLLKEKVEEDNGKKEKS
jgi:hypothetical protein